MESWWPAVDPDDVAWVDETQMIEVDRVMIEDLNITLIQMMENAGRNLARLAAGLVAPRSAVVCAGTGGNGGGGLVAARHLHNMGVDVEVVLSRDRGHYDGVPGHQLDIIDRLSVPIVAEPRSADVVLDALIGYSLRGAPRGRAAELIERINAGRSEVIALDVPSGLDSTTGEAPGVAVNASATLTLSMPKIGLRHSPQVGRLFVGDISVPPSVYSTLGFDLPTSIFGERSIVEVSNRGMA